MNRNQIARDICDACDEEFGGQHRAEAIERANALIAGYEVDKPKNEIEAYEVMRRAYREVAAKEAARMKAGTYDPKAFAAT